MAGYLLSVVQRAICWATMSASSCNDDVTISCSCYSQRRLRGILQYHLRPLSSCNAVRTAFTAVTRVQIPSGTPNLFRNLRAIVEIFVGTKRHNSDRITTSCAVQSQLFSRISVIFSQAQQVFGRSNTHSSGRPPHLARCSAKVRAKLSTASSTTTLTRTQREYFNREARKWIRGLHHCGTPIPLAQNRAD